MSVATVLAGVITLLMVAAMVVNVMDGSGASVPRPLANAAGLLLGLIGLVLLIGFSFVLAISGIELVRWAWGLIAWP